ncbi:MAG: hypothetical protein ACOYT8_00545 [Candidatus Dependentiae bacterium]
MKKTFLAIFIIIHQTTSPNDSLWDKLKLVEAIGKLAATTCNVFAIGGKVIQVNNKDDIAELKKQARLLKLEKNFIDCLVTHAKRDSIDDIPGKCSECLNAFKLAGGAQKANELIQEYKDVIKTIKEKETASGELSSSQKALIISGCVFAVAATGVAIVMIPGAAPAIITVAKSAADIARDATTQYINDFKNLPTTDKIIHVAKIADKVNTSSIEPLKESEFLSDYECELIELKREAREKGSLTERVQKKYS